MTILSFLTFVFIVIIVTTYTCTTSKTTRCISTFDNQEYSVLDTPEALQVANTLAQLNKRTLLLIDHLKLRAPTSPITITLDKKYSYKILSEAPVQKGMTTYTINKKFIKMCIKSQKQTSIYDINTLMYVLLHELAHMANTNTGHGKEFLDIFKFLTLQAIQAGVYTPDNYRLEPREYCEIQLNSYIA
jgi:hypothetical protein